MGILGKFSDASRSMTEMSKNASETKNLRVKILYEQDKIQENMLKIGELYYESQEAEIQIIRELCADIDDRKRRIQSMKSDLYQMKGKRVCPNCGMQFDEKYQFEFCGKCGSKLENEEE